MSLCLVGAAKAVQISAVAFTLSWTHTVQRSEWQEDWQVVGDRLFLDEARIQGSGAGMEPPDEAVLRDGFYVWKPNLLPIPELILRRAPEAGDWRLCAAGRCAQLGEWLGGEADPVTFRACRSTR
jgi:hypothetical protein